VAGELFAAAGAGLLLGIQFNPLASVAGAALAAGLATARRMWAAALVLAGAWALGDGMLLLSRGTDALADSGIVTGGAGAQWTVLALWGVAGFAIGYALPAWAGAFVGRRVTHGTGWLAAGAVAVTASAALSMLSGGLGG
jgi:hypothetical protein